MSDDWLSLLAAELHKPVKRNFPKRCVLSNGIDEIWAADLVEMEIILKVEQRDKISVDGYRCFFEIWLD